MLLSELPEKVLKPAIHQQVCAMQHRMTQAGKVQAWTAFQVLPGALSLHKTDTGGSQTSQSVLAQ